MPPIDKTPARRFLPTSSSTPRSTGSVSFRRQPPQSLSQTLSAHTISPFSATPRFHRPGTGERDDIDSNSDDPGDSPVLPQRPSSDRILAKSEVIEDGFTTTVPSNHDQPSTVQREDRKQQGHHVLNFCTPASKRRKIFPMSSVKSQPITISSSPDHDELEADDSASDGPDLAGLESDSGDNLDEDKILQHTQPASTSRFRVATPASEHNELFPRKTFKATSGEHHRNNPAGATALPDVFSPSKPKGKHDYAATGSANLVRSWILDVAAQESQTPQTDEHVIIVAYVVKDASGRFAIVLDQDGRSWLLPHQDTKFRGGFGLDLNQVCQGSRVLIKGYATQWKVHITSSTLQEPTVAAYWDLYQS